MARNIVPELERRARLSDQDVYRQACDEIRELKLALRECAAKIVELETVALADQLEGPAHMAARLHRLYALAKNAANSDTEVRADVIAFCEPWADDRYDGDVFVKQEG